MAVNADVEILQAALIGLQHMLSQVEQKIEDLRNKVGQPSASFSLAAPGAPRKRNLSAEARERIAAAQRKRWAAFKNAKRKKSAMSAAGQQRTKNAAVSTRRSIAQRGAARKSAAHKSAAIKTPLKKPTTPALEQSAAAS
jgi:hypothetical protein